ncbi:ketopantoate reductase family protein [Primorskyibacter sp. 2E107]|uniref:ketopantoate reductase family protein n=1 Tax=Primorskyibacter sp. 2E107 TaxID=3403458 RepID=UPI003AF66F4C
MRIIILGTGAIGGALAVELVRSGAEVLCVARGAQLEAIRSRGLRLQAPGMDVTAQVPVVAHPSEVDFRADDMILLCMKTQHTVAALEDLAAAGVMEQPIFCLQNGVTNERMALRRFPNVHGVLVMVPATLVEPGHVAVFSTPKLGILDVGRYPAGSDAADAALVERLQATRLAAFVDRDVITGKYGKLLVNLNNIVEAILGRGVEVPEIKAALKAEAEAVLTAAGTAWRKADSSDPRRDAFLNVTEIEGVSRIGGSTTQSLMRGAGSVETDYLNGEIVLMARMHGVPAPVNERICRIASAMARAREKPGALDAKMLMRKLGL